jgi:hypothetical protein
MEQVADEAPHSKIFFDHVRFFLSDLVFVFTGKWQGLGVLVSGSFIYFRSFTCLYYLLADVEGLSRVGMSTK